MDKQLHQLVVASVVALLTSGTITLVGLSAAEEGMHMDGGGSPPPSGGSYSPPPDGGGSYQQPSGGSSYQEPAGGSSYTQPSGGDWSQHSGSPEGNWSEHSGQPSGGSANYQGGDHTGSSGQWGVGVGGGHRDGAGFQKDGEGFQRHGQNYQKDGAGFQKDWGRGGTTAPAGMGNESHMGRFGDSDRGDSSGAGHMGDMGNKAGGKKKMQDMSDFGDDNAGPGHEQMMKKFMHGAPGGSEGEGSDHAMSPDQYIRGKFNMSDFEQFVPKKSSADVDSLLNSLPAGADEDAAPALTAAQESKVEKSLDKADAVEEKTVASLQRIFDKKPTKSAASKATKYILALVKEWVSADKLADGLADVDSDVVDHAENTATSLGTTIAEACEAASEFFDGKWKGEKVCDKVEDQMHAAAEEE